MSNKILKKILLVMMLSGIAMTAFAEDAPVYDVDNYPPQFDGQPVDNNAAAPQQPVATQSQPSAPTQEAPAIAETETPPPASVQSLPLDQRVARVEQQVTNLQQRESAAKLNAMHTEMQALRGQIENLTHQIQQMQTQQRSMYSDLDKRINKQTIVNQTPVATQQSSTDDDLPVKPKALLKPKPKTVTVKTKTVVAATTDENPVKTPDNSALSSASGSDQEELQMYQNAYDLIKDSKFDQAIAVLQNMLKKYPSGQSAANAHYWLGELYGLQKNKDQAAIEFSTVVKDYPDSPKVSDAEVKLGMIYAAQFKWNEAKTTFKKVMTHYPGTTSARLASQQLKELKAGGH